ncbi:MAG: RNA 2',3'-cyclic phosphodiesterase [Nanoarchaeota archaeon]
MRCFIAIELPEHVKSKVFHEIEKLQTAEGISGKFTDKNNLHLTLKFLGELTEPEIEEIKTKLQEVSEKFSGSFDLLTQNYGFFPSKEHIKVVWLGVKDNENKLLELEKEISKNLLKYPGDFKEFKPHLTLGRIKDIRDKEKFFEKINNLKKIKESFQVNKIVLMKSELTSKGSLYRKIQEFNLERK